MRYLINTILFSSLCLSVDVLSIKLPVNAKSLSYTGYGIATKNNYSLNPATLSNSEKSYFEFSNNKWLFDVDGAYNIRYEIIKKRISKENIAKQWRNVLCK